ncbi:H-NS family nucleoid-associated regulatory protein [Caballeronia sp. 15711]|uniref:H-NS family nucleoid-associated regulatory protein n=1 Tax=Caballeronia sp. 15711 TaxID=3391029 RepID=UPI0039E65525
MPTLEQIQAKMLKLQTQADALIAKGAQAALDQIQQIMLEHGLTTGDIEAKAKAKSDSKSTNGVAPKVRSKAAGSAKGPKSSKYLHPKTGATWTGHGRPPAWIVNVKDRSKFLIEGNAETAPAVNAIPVNKAKTAAKKASKSASNAVAHRGQRTGPQPAKYHDPKSGATWSGKGPAPAWLVAVKDRSKYLIDGAGTVAPEATTRSKAGKSQSSGSGSVTNKAATKKTVAKKSGAKKAIPEKVTAVVAAAEPTI